LGGNHEQRVGSRACNRRHQFVLVAHLEHLRLQAARPGRIQHDPGEDRMARIAGLIHHIHTLGARHHLMQQAQGFRDQVLKPP
jgi:hypothetical protein